MLYENSYISAMDTLSFSQTRANLKAVMDRVVADKAPVAITRQTAEGVVIISQSDWNAIEETLYLLQSPGNAQRLLESVAELDAASLGRISSPRPRVRRWSVRPDMASQEADWARPALTHAWHNAIIAK